MYTLRDVWSVLVRCRAIIRYPTTEQWCDAVGTGRSVYNSWTASCSAYNNTSSADRQYFPLLIHISFKKRRCGVTHSLCTVYQSQQVNGRPKWLPILQSAWKRQQLSIASALSSALTIYPCQIRLQSINAGSLNFPTAQKKEWWPATADSLPQAVTCQHCTHYVSWNRTHNLPIRRAQLVAAVVLCKHKSGALTVTTTLWVKKTGPLFYGL